MQGNGRDNQKKNSTMGTKKGKLYKEKKRGAFEGKRSVDLSQHTEDLSTNNTRLNEIRNWKSSILGKRFQRLKK